MKRKLILLLIFLCKLCISDAQSKSLDLRQKLTTFLFKLSKKENTDSINQYIIEFSANKKGTIKNSNIYTHEKGIVVKETSNEFNGQNLDSLYSISGTEKKERGFKVALPVIIKKTQYTEYSKTAQLFSIFEIESIYTLLRLVQSKSKKSILLNPLIPLKLPDEF